jgi:L-amino acid N-acyltransferase
VHTDDLRLRDAEHRDADALAAIYNDAVLNTTAIWNDAPVDSANRVAWLDARRSSGYPVIVAVDADDQVLGYASFGDWRPFDGFRHTVEHSVYVRSGQRGRGIGRVLMTALIERARLIGKHVMVAAIEAGNAGSIGLHEKLGFESTGTLRQVGTKFGDWLDLTFMQLVLEEPATA